MSKQKLPRKTKKQKERAQKILHELYTYYPDPECELDHRNPFELLIATILSAQCTDVRVNKVTPELFELYPTPELMKDAPIEDLEELVRTTGFFSGLVLGATVRGGRLITDSAQLSEFR